MKWLTIINLSNKTKILLWYTKRLDKINQILPILNWLLKKLKFNIKMSQLFGPRCQVKLNFQLYWRLHCFHCLQFAHSGGPESETMSISSLIELNTLRGDHCLRFQLIIAPSSNGHRCLLSLPNQFWNREAWAINQPWLHLHFGLLNSIH